MNKRYLRFIVLLTLLSGAGMSCRKTDFGGIGSPAYLRVFNCLDYKVTLGNKDAPQPFLVMLIDPVTDADGIPESAAITGDFLDKRNVWAMPYPDAVNTTVWQTEYPGNLKVLAAPILNGYDLSSWAQVPSGKHHIVFRTRPHSDVPYFQLDKSLRGTTIADTSVDLQTNEVYTLEVLKLDYATNKPGLYLRNETFVKQPLSDSMVYVNFYNLSSNGFFDYASTHINNNDVPNKMLRDTMNVYYSLTRFVAGNIKPIPGYDGLPMGPVVRSLDPHLNPYYAFPLFADTSALKIFTGNMGQLFRFYATGFTPESTGFPANLAPGTYSSVRMGDYGPNPGGDWTYPFTLVADLRTGLIISIHSGTDNPRSFATVNTIEYINGQFYLTTIQRKFAPPIY
jgi:hypothetical protein